MSNREKHVMLRAMTAYGGGFVSALAEAWTRADVVNEARLLAAFPDLVEKYGPGSALSFAIEQQAA